jgi:hypothetical protein
MKISQNIFLETVLMRTMTGTKNNNTGSNITG